MKIIEANFSGKIVNMFLIFTLEAEMQPSYPQEKERYPFVVVYVFFLLRNKRIYHKYVVIMCKEKQSDERRD